MAVRRYGLTLISLEVTTSITDLLRKHPSDKVSSHSYGPLYDELFSPFRDSATAILEIGIEGGNSLRAWRDYFTNAHIWGLDNEMSKMIAEPRITTVHCDMKERDRILTVRNAMPQFDIICDDASHVIDLQIWAVAVFWSKLKPRGLFIVEDVLYPQYLELFDCFQNTKLYDLRYVRGQHDDMLAVMRK